MLSYRSENTKRDVLEPPEGEDQDEGKNSEDNGFRFCGQVSRGEDEVVEDMWEHEHREVESG